MTDTASLAPMTPILFAVAGSALSTALPVYVGVRSVVRMTVRAMRLVLLPTVPNGVIGWRHGFEVRRVATPSSRASAFGSVVNVTAIGDRADKQLVRQSVRADDLAFDRDPTVSALRRVAGKRPARIRPTGAVHARPKTGGVIELAALPRDRAPARAESTVIGIDGVLAPWGKCRAALLARMGMIRLHLRGLSWVPRSGLLAQRRSFPLPELYPVGA